MFDVAIKLENRPGAMTEMGEALGMAGPANVGRGRYIEVVYSDHAKQLCLVVDDIEEGWVVSNDNVFDWASRTPMLLVSLEGDGVVSPENTTNAFNAMRRRGVGRDSMRRLIIKDGTLNHVTAVPAAMSAVRSFFDGGFGSVREAQ